MQECGGDVKARRIQRRSGPVAKMARAVYAQLCVPLCFTYEIHGVSDMGGKVNVCMCSFNCDEQE